LNGEQLSHAFRITFLPLIEDALATGIPLPEIIYTLEQTAKRAEARTRGPVQEEQHDSPKEES